MPPGISRKQRFSERRPDLVRVVPPHYVAASNKPAATTRWWPVWIRSGSSARAVLKGRPATGKKLRGRLREAGLCQVDDDPEVVAERVRASNIRDRLVVALDDWTLCVSRGTDVCRVPWLHEVARRADPYSAGWRDRFRDLVVRSDRGELTRVAETASVAETPVTLLVALGGLEKRGGDAIPFYKNVRQRHPNNFWANFLPEYALRDRETASAIRFYQAALAIRPNTPSGWIARCPDSSGSDQRGGSKLTEGGGTRLA